MINKILFGAPRKTLLPLQFFALLLFGIKEGKGEVEDQKFGAIMERIFKFGAW